MNFKTILNLLSIITLYQVSAIAGPKLTMKEPEFNFGYVPQAAKISHDFWLYSTGDSTLKIIKVSPG